MNASGALILRLADGREQQFVLSKPVILVGRDAMSDILLRDARVSRQHARIECGDAGCTVVDLDSANGTLVNGRRISRAPLAGGDEIRLGDCVLFYETRARRVAPDITIIDGDAGDAADGGEETLPDSRLTTELNDTARPRLVIVTPGRTWEAPFDADALTLGRHADNDVDLEFPNVSRHHARIERRGDDFILRDLGSANGTWVGGIRVDTHTLRDGDNARIGPVTVAFKRGFADDRTADDRTVVDPASPSDRHGQRRPVVFVPGFTGSELWHGNERIWPDMRDILATPERFACTPDDGIEPRGLVGELVIVPNLVKQEQYDRMGDFLEESLGYARGKDLLEFGYDWRQDNRQSAARLAQAIDEWQARSPDANGPITLIAHSMGCLVSRWYVEHLGGKRKVARLLLIGGPHAGTPKIIPAIVRGRFLPFGLMGERMRKVIETFPSVYQLLPTYACVSDQSRQRIDVLTDESWVEEVHRGLLRDARHFRRELGTHSSVPAVSIFGYGLKTAMGLHVQRDSDGVWRKADLEMTENGDETIPETSAVLNGSDVHPVRQSHGSLYVDNDVKMRLKIELGR
jgi:pSer/pThr/pTyr-binding forkhead associated (FHA) protein